MLFCRRISSHLIGSHLISSDLIASSTGPSCKEWVAARGPTLRFCDAMPFIARGTLSARYVSFLSTRSGCKMFLSVLHFFTHHFNVTILFSSLRLFFRLDSSASFSPLRYPWKDLRALRRSLFQLRFLETRQPSSHYRSAIMSHRYKPSASASHPSPRSSGHFRYRDSTTTRILS